MDPKRAARIEALKHTAAFGELAAELQEVEDKFWKRHIADLKQGAAIDQRALDRMLGRFDAIRLILAQPERAARVLAQTKESDAE